MKFGLIKLSTASQVLWREGKLLDGFAERLWGAHRVPIHHPQRALWFPHCGAIHTWRLRQSLDVIALNRQHSIIAVHRNLAPGRYWSIAGASSIIEVAAGCRWPLEHWQRQAQTLTFEELSHD